VGLVIDFMFGR